jgi:hypothetical protein
MPRRRHLQGLVGNPSTLRRHNDERRGLASGRMASGGGAYPGSMTCLPAGAHTRNLVPHPWRHLKGQLPPDGCSALYRTAHRGKSTGWIDDITSRTTTCRTRRKLVHLYHRPPRWMPFAEHAHTLCGIPFSIKG